MSDDIDRQTTYVLPDGGDLDELAAAFEGLATRRVVLVVRHGKLHLFITWAESLGEEELAYGQRWLVERLHSRSIKAVRLTESPEGRA